MANQLSQPRSIITSKPAREHFAMVQNHYKQTLDGMQEQSAKRAQIQANTPPQVHPLAQVGQDMSFDELVKANPAAAFFRANARPPQPEELQPFIQQFNPDLSGAMSTLLNG